jgi:hypothetical protein
MVGLLGGGYVHQLHGLEEPAEGRVFFDLLGVEVGEGIVPAVARSTAFFQSLPRMVAVSPAAFGNDLVDDVLT